jgi:hypothetical protein
MGLMTFAETGLGKKRAINNRVVQEPSSSISFAQCPQVARGVGDGGLTVDVADPLEVIEQVMRYYLRAGCVRPRN